MSYMTRLEGVPDTDEALPGMAFFAGTGPDGKTCGHCKWRGYYRENKKEKLVRTAGCQLYRKLSGGKDGSPVKKRYPACKYFEQIEKNK